MLLLFAFLGRQPGRPYGLSGSRPLRDFLLVLILYASMENKFFFFFFFFFVISLDTDNTIIYWNNNKLCRVGA